MKEFEYEYDGKEFLVCYDKIEAEDLLRRLIGEKAIKEHLAFCSPFYNYDKEVKKSNKYIITNYREESIPWIDVWDYYIWEYDKYTIPYLARLIKSVLRGNTKAFEEIYFPVYEKEYLPISEVVNDCIKDIDSNNQEKIVNPCPKNWFPNSSTNVYRLKERRKTIKKCGELLSDDEYLNSYIKYYEEAKNLFLVEEKVIKENQKTRIK